MTIFPADVLLPSAPVQTQPPETQMQPLDPSFDDPDAAVILVACFTNPDLAGQASQRVVEQRMAAWASVRDVTATSRSLGHVTTAGHSLLVVLTKARHADAVDQIIADIAGDQPTPTVYVAADRVNTACWALLDSAC